MPTRFTPIDTKKTLQEREVETIEYWKKNNIFEKSLIKAPENSQYQFVDGPPFVTGNPHYGSLLPSIAKDVIPRFQTMKGKRVRRVFGWDCHGLPIEERVNKIFNIRSSHELEKKLGVKKYVEECRKYVESTSSEWRWYIDRIGRWVDMDNAYFTMHVDFMESVLWAFKKLYDKGLIYEGKRVSLFSTDTSTPVSGFEVAMDADNYRDVEDLAIYTKFKLVSPPSWLSPNKRDVFAVAWTTTPWTIPSNFALAVHKEFTYVLVEYENELLIIVKDRLEEVFKEKGMRKVLKEFKGVKLEHLEYEPVYDYFLKDKKPQDFKIYLRDDVLNTEGTGVLHIAPAFGEVDFEAGKELGLSDIADIDIEGKMIIEPWKGIYLRDASVLIAEDLQKKGNLLHSETYTHRLPFYRGKNPLIYMAQDAYFINIQKIKKQMLDLNEKTNWIPSHIKHGRFAQMIETSPDWCISRNRYWATIMPIWKNEESDVIVIGSLDEMMEYTKDIVKREENGKFSYFFQNKPMDLHRDVCDEIVLTKNGKSYHRISEVLDCWMDSGSVPFAQYHYPFENKEIYEKGMPADFIIEYVAQVRAWFNVLLRISTMVFDEAAFINVISTGVLAGEDGRKMSKSFGNYPDPRQTIEKYGADALRLYFMNSPIMMGEDMNFSETDLSDYVKSVLNILWNTYNYFVTYANIHSWSIPKHSEFSSENILDKWIYARLKETMKSIHDGLESYTIPHATRVIRPFVDDLSTWYIRRSRSRFVEGDTHAFTTLYLVLCEFSKAVAPIIPFIAEEIYRNLTNKESVHLENYPEIKETSSEEKKIIETMQFIREIASLGQLARIKAKIPVKQPLSVLEIRTAIKLESEYLSILENELNIKQIKLTLELDASLLKVTDKDQEIGLNISISDDLRVEGKIREIARFIQTQRKEEEMSIEDHVEVEWYTLDKDFEMAIDRHGEELKKMVNADNFKKLESPQNLKSVGKDFYLKLIHK